MTIGIKDLVDQINSEIYSPANDSTRVAQLAGSTTFNTYSVATVDALPLASENTGRFILVLSSDSYYFSDGVKWTNKVESTTSNIITPWLWGCNTQGQLGDGTTTNKCSPISLSYDNFGWTDISLSYQGIALRGDGTAWTWGSGNSGALGNGIANIDKSSPVSVIGGFVDWSSISAGNNAMIGIRKNGTAWSWGRNVNGQLGDNTGTDRCSPVSVVGGFVDWSSISAGRDVMIGIRKNGTAWSWGNNTSGKLGDGTTTTRSSPVSVVGGFVDWSSISAGRDVMIGIRKNGTAWAWGANSFGQLGDGTTTTRSSPVSVVGGFTDWCGISAGSGGAIGVRQNGTAWTWGDGAAGGLGDGTIVDKSSPVSVVGGFTDWCNVSMAFCWSVGVRTNGTAWAWGANSFGQLGDSTVTSKSSPVSVVGGFTDWRETHLGIAQTAILRYTPKGF